MYADMAELADAPDLGSGGVPRAGSIPVIRSHSLEKASEIYGFGSFLIFF